MASDTRDSPHIAPRWARRHLVQPPTPEGISAAQTKVLQQPGKPDARLVLADLKGGPLDSRSVASDPWLYSRMESTGVLRTHGRPRPPDTAQSRQHPAMLRHFRSSQPPPDNTRQTRRKSPRPATSGNLGKPTVPQNSRGVDIDKAQKGIGAGPAGVAADHA